MSFKFTAVGSSEQVVAQLTEVADESRNRPGQDHISRSLALVLMDCFKNSHVFIPHGQELAYLIQGEGMSRQGEPIELRLSVQAVWFQPAEPNPDDDRTAQQKLQDEVDAAMAYDSGDAAGHPQPTDGNTDPRLLEKKSSDPLAATGGVIGDDARIMEF